MLLKISTLLAKLRAKLDEKGQGMVEYALILAAVALIAVVAIWGGGKEEGDKSTDLQTAVTNAFNKAATEVDKAQNKGSASTPQG